MTESAALLDELKRDPIAKRRGPSIADAGKRSEKGFAALVKRLTKLVALRDPAAHAFLVELWREHPSQKLGAALEALMLESGERALLEPIAARNARHALATSGRVSIDEDSASHAVRGSSAKTAAQTEPQLTG